MFEFRRLYCARAKLHAPFPFDGLLRHLNTQKINAFHHRHYQTTIIRADWYFRWAKPEPYSATSQCNHSED